MNILHTAKDYFIENIQSIISRNTDKKSFEAYIPRTKLKNDRKAKSADDKNWQEQNNSNNHHPVSSMHIVETTVQCQTNFLNKITV